MINRQDFDLSKGYRIYLNLHKDMFSIQAWNVKKKGWRVYSHMKSLVASSVTFKVYESGRQRVLKERRKNVHAYVCAKHISYAPPREKGLRNEITYNPYKGGEFTSRELKLEVVKCHTLYLTNKKMYGDKIKYNMNIGRQTKKIES